MTEPPSLALVDLQRRYLAEFPGLVEDVRADITAFRAARAEAPAALRARLTRLADLSASGGFAEIGALAREMDQWVAAGPAPGEAPWLDQALERLTALFRRAQGRLGVPAPSPASRPRALVILPSSPDADRVVARLEEEGYAVRRGDRRDDPDATPVGERPDLLVVGAAVGEGDPSAIASAWTARSPRPRAVVLVETLRAVDRLRAAASGVDAVVAGEAMVARLPRYARTLADVGPPPSTVLLVDHDGERAAVTAGVLESADIRVVRCAVAQAVQELLEREVPDLMLLASSLPDAEGVAIARLVREDSRFRLMPIVVAGPGDVADRVRALRAGTEDYLPDGSDPALLLATVVARAERGRRVRELLTRDPLTGLLNQASLIGELEHAVDYGRRHGDTLTLVVFDLDRFHQVNERFGLAVGDQVLRHVANVFRANVRASDVIGRIGGEEFGMILRGVGSPGAAVLSGKLRRVLGEQSATTAEGVIIPLHVSVGAACFPGDGTGSGELVHAAVRAMQREKMEKG